jgi:NTP pyrophosphatase (non-canonical NTP hydrolase)
VDIADLQRTIRETYGAQDRERGLARTYAWFVEEVGELSRAIFREDHDARVHEFSDALAWLVTLADLSGVDLAEAAERYRDGCPKCHERPCRCGTDHTAGPTDG